MLSNNCEIVWNKHCKSCKCRPMALFIWMLVADGQCNVAEIWTLPGPKAVPSLGFPTPQAHLPAKVIWRNISKNFNSLLLFINKLNCLQKLFEEIYFKLSIHNKLNWLQKVICRDYLKHMGMWLVWVLLHISSDWLANTKSMLRLTSIYSLILNKCAAPPHQWFHWDAMMRFSPWKKKAPRLR